MRFASMWIRDGRRQAMLGMAACCSTIQLIPGHDFRASKGVKQGVFCVAGSLFVPIFGVMAGSHRPRLRYFRFFCPITAIISSSAPERMLFAGILKKARRQNLHAAVSYIPPAMPPPPQARVSALPPPSVSTQPWRARPDTAEIVPPTSVPDHTTKPLEKTESEKN